MKAIILAAGRGSRLSKFTQDKPKCLNSIGRKSILERQIETLKSSGVDEIVAVSGYRAQMLEGYGIRTVHNPEWEKTNMVKSLLCAGNEFNEPVIVSYSDIIYDRDIVSNLVRKKRDAVVVYDLEWKRLWEARFGDPLKDAESFKIDQDGLIKDIGRKVDNIEDIEGQYIGLMRFSAKALSWIVRLAQKAGRKVLNKMYMTTLLHRLIREGYPIYGMPIEGGWCEVDTERDLELANQLYNDGLLIGAR
ncbi:MAG: phosphocholine cytidylyltransferase family protein [Candidatus Omnitrophica bacterium]|nr:phosphocholine cytidylyltransferase family protein [Candidatus Omnitrophota bacterium]